MAGRIEDQLDYDPITGFFTWKINKRRARMGDRAGCVDGGRYRYIKIDYKKVAEHRLAVYFMTGNWPREQVDHINNITDDNRWCNLRECTSSQNMSNRSPKGISKMIGVYPIRDKYRATGFNKKYLGQFDTPEEAYEIATNHRKQFVGDFVYGG